VVSSLHVVFAAPSSSHAFPAPVCYPTHRRQSFMDFFNVSPSHRLQVSTNCSGMGPFHGMQSFMNRSLSCGYPTGSQVLPEILLLHGVLSMAPQVLPGACSSMGSPRGHSLFGHMHLLWHGVLHRPQVDISSIMVFSMGCRAISAPVPGAPLAPPSSLTLVSAELFLSRTLTPLSG